jgi:hypothetical protein
MVNYSYSISTKLIVVTLAVLLVNAGAFSQSQPVRLGGKVGGNTKEMNEVSLSIDMRSFSKSLQFGIEAGGKTKKMDVASIFDKSTFASQIGAYMKLPFSDQFYARLSVGLNQNYAHRTGVKGNIVESSGTIINDTLMYPSESFILHTFSISVEPRYNILFNEEATSALYLAIPITFETASINKCIHPIRPEFKITPSLGYRYEFGEHWGVEGNAGLGWTKYINMNNSSFDDRTWSYDLSVRLGYKF